MRPESVSVYGAGSWGSAIAILLCSNINSVTLWGRNSEDISKAQKSRQNEHYLPGIIYPDNLELETAFENTIGESLAFVVVVPSHAFRTTVEAIAEATDQAGYSRDNISLIWGTKGFDMESGRLLSDVAKEILGKSARTGMVSGPSFAMETAKGMPTALTVASNNVEDAESMAEWFRSPSTRVYFSDDLIGVQLGSAIKNVMAIAAGISDGLGYGANARAALITRGLSELTRLGMALGGKSTTFMGLTGVGDLILTCTDNQSRNRRFGIGIGEGRKADEISKEIGQEIEGINTTRELFAISQKAGVDMPITEQVYKIIHENAEPAAAVKSLLSRDPKAESS